MTLYTAKMTEELYSTKIGAAVLPLRAVSMDAAEERARDIVARVYAKLHECGWDLEAAYPRPNSYTMDRSTYLTVQARNVRARGLTKSQPAQRVNYTTKARYLRIKDEAAVERFVTEARDMAAAQYDAFVAKLVNKIGEHTAAVLEGDHVWGESFLTVTKADGSKETWKTHQIWNVSKLGKDFPQWPSRKQKVARK
jgi:hypothetical protein